ncbi:MAG TPA: type IX secretion system membrane protein PorP/SprF, partial [Cyclobacteriaceae bacterium]|nr:type IX secretion system membrane protein PorP/SprF [Cyclobacteriaceae bacterium]
LEANPVTVNFNSHLSVYQNKVGLGLMVIQDQIGDTKNTEFMTLYSYKIRLKTADLSFGMQTGFIRYTNNPSMLTIRDPDDPAFTAINETKFNTGAGILLKSDRYMVGISVPRLIPTTLSQGGQSIQLYNQSYYFFGSYVVFISEDVRFKPSVLLRGSSGLPLSVDLNASFNFKEYYTGGIYTRNFKSFGILMQAVVKGFRIGYTFELPTSSTSSLNFASHEIMVGISTGILPFHDRSLKTF